MATREISKEAFCRLTQTDEDSWIFDGAAGEKFWMEDDGRIYFGNCRDTTWQFRAEGGVVYASHCGPYEGDSWTDWTVWCELDPVEDVPDECGIRPSDCWVPIEMLGWRRPILGVDC